MVLTPGTRLGPYEVVAPLGAGGMGEVYRARDTRLDRTVAIKVLPTDLAADPDRRARFEREAKAVAALDHPHICGLFDVGESDGTHFLVMPLLDGQTLAARLEKGPLPLDQALTVGGEIAQALAAAHRQGLVHRDLKPANVMLTKTGAKLLDFGLAKLLPPGGAVALRAAAGAATTTAGTAAGTILGTVHYMAPEQVEGKEVDARSDIWALGAVLHEMVTGAQAFQGDTAASVIGAILRDTPPPVSQRRPLSPPLLDRVVAGCLEKEPEARWQSAADVSRLLGALPESSSASGAPRPEGRRNERGAWLATTTALLAVLGWLALRPSPAPPASDAVRLSVLPPAGTVYTGHLMATVPTPQFALSRDGRALAFVAAQPGARPTLWVRSLESTTARMLPATEDATEPSWSPDGRWIAYFDLQGRLKKVNVDGGSPQTISDSVVDARGLSWGADDMIVFGASYDGLFRIPAVGGQGQPFTALDVGKQEGSHRYPQVLHDSRRVLFTVRSGLADQRGLYAVEDGRARRRILSTDASVSYAPPGSLLYMNEDALMAQGFDAARLEVHGAPVALERGVARSSRGTGAFSVSDVGRLAYAEALLNPGRLTWYDRAGAARGSVGPEGDHDFSDFRLSPDDTHLVASLVDPRTSMPDVWVVDLVRGGSSRLTFGPALNSAPIWSPDVGRIAYRTNRRGLTELYQRSAGTGGVDEPLLSEQAARAVGVGLSNLIPYDWSRDGKQIVFSVGIPADLWLLPTTGGGAPSKLTSARSDEFHANFSPDGQSIAYTSSQSGRFDVFVETLPLSGRKELISPAGGYEPRWRADGRELYYLTEDGELMAVPVIPSDPPGAPRFGAPRALFKTQVYPGVSQLRTHYVPNRDGTRFLIHTRSGILPPASITVVLNWPSLLKR